VNANGARSGAAPKLRLSSAEQTAFIPHLVRMDSGSIPGSINEHPKNPDSTAPGDILAQCPGEHPEPPSTRRARTLLGYEHPKASTKPKTDQVMVTPPDPSIRRERERVLSTGMRARAVECGVKEGARGESSGLRPHPGGVRGWLRCTVEAENPQTFPQRIPPAD